MSGMKSTLDGIDNRSGTTKQNISKLEDRNRSYTNKISNKQTEHQWTVGNLQATYYVSNWSPQSRRADNTWRNNG